MMNDFSLLIFIICSLIPILFFYKLEFFSKKINLFDKPDNKLKIHKKNTLSGGGIIFASLTLIIFSYEIFYYESDLFFIEGSKTKFVFFFGIFSTFFLGLYDDKYTLLYKSKFIYLILIIYICLLIDNDLSIKVLRFDSFKKIIYLNNFDNLFTCLCILLFINALNLFDGLNLQVGAYVALIFLIFTFLFNQTYFIYYFFGFLIFLIFNHRTKIFLGNNGSLFFGFFISYFTIKFHNYNYIKSDEVFLLMMIPGMDMFRLFLMRIIKGKNPFKGDRNHIHHLISKRFNHFVTFLIIQLNIATPIIAYYYFKSSMGFSILLGIFIYLLLILKFTNIKNKKKFKF